MTGQPGGQGEGIQRRGGKRESKADSKDLRMSVRKAIHWVPAIWEGRMLQLAEELVKSGQHQNLMLANTPIWESTTTAGILMAIPVESGAIPLTQMSNGSTALSQYVSQC